MLGFFLLSARLSCVKRNAVRAVLPSFLPERIAFHSQRMVESDLWAIIVRSIVLLRDPHGFSPNFVDETRVATSQRPRVGLRYLSVSVVEDDPSTSRDSSIR